MKSTTHKHMFICYAYCTLTHGLSGANTERERASEKERTILNKPEHIILVYRRRRRRHRRFYFHARAFVCTHTHIHARRIHGYALAHTHTYAQTYAFESLKYSRSFIFFILYWKYFFRMLFSFLFFLFSSFFLSFCFLTLNSKYRSEFNSKSSSAMLYSSGCSCSMLSSCTHIRCWLFHGTYNIFDFFYFSRLSFVPLFLFCPAFFSFSDTLNEFFLFLRVHFLAMLSIFAWISFLFHFR